MPGLAAGPGRALLGVLHGAVAGEAICRAWARRAGRLLAGAAAWAAPYLPPTWHAWLAARLRPAGSGCGQSAAPPTSVAIVWLEAGDERDAARLAARLAALVQWCGEAGMRTIFLYDIPGEPC